MTMMFNGMVCVDSDNSDFAKDSGGGSSCAGACERYYRDKLLATLQVLENKEETIRVQGCSLGVAEDRIAELSKRATQLRRELDLKARELTQLRQFADSCRVDKSDACVTAKEVDSKRLVHTLQNNLTAVTDLYRECFYEAAKQEELIDVLRKSYLDVRLMERDKADRIARLQRVVDTQKRAVEQCQDVVMEVESLKSEISSFLNSSNNDSGMWERGSESPDVGEELTDILDQLRQLQHMLTSDCTCGLEEENTALKERNRMLEGELEQVRQRNKELDGCLRCINQQHETQIKEKERQVQEAVKKLEEAENTCNEKGKACENLKRRLQQTQVMLDDKTAEMTEAQQTCVAKEVAIRELRRELEQSEQCVQQGLKKLSEVTQLRSQLLLESQAQITELEQRLKVAARRCRDLEAGCRERDRSTLELQACLEEAQARGARLCEESRRVTAGVRQWMRDKKQQTREQQDKIKMQKLRIRELERRIAMRQNMELTSQCESESSSGMSLCDGTYPPCSRLRPSCRSETNALRGSVADCATRENETASCSKCASNRQESGSEMASCSRAPVPPTRKKRQQSFDNLGCGCASLASLSGARLEARGADVRWTRLYRYSRVSRPAPAPAPAPAPGSGSGSASAGCARSRTGYASRSRQDTSGPGDGYSRLARTGSWSGADVGAGAGAGGAGGAGSVLQRVELLHAALQDGRRRWGRRPTTAPRRGDTAPPARRGRGLLI